MISPIRPLLFHDPVCVGDRSNVRQTPVPPFSPLRLLLLLAALMFLVAFVELGVLSVAFDKLGLSPCWRTTLSIR